MAIVAAAAVAGAPALADGMLSPGKPAGVHEARLHRPNLLLIGGVAVAVVAGIVVAVTNSSNSSCSAAACPNTAVSTSTTG